MPAMPSTTWDNEFDKIAEQSDGLTKREHFAAMAMQGFLSNSSWLMPLMQKANGDPVIVNCAVKELSYQLADKMLEDK